MRCKRKQRCAEMGVSGHILVTFKIYFCVYMTDTTFSWHAKSSGNLGGGRVAGLSRNFYFFLWFLV